MTKLIYSSNGLAIADCCAEEIAKTLKWQDLYVSTENVVVAFKTLVKEKFFTKDEVKIYYDDEGVLVGLTVYSDGGIDPHPPGFCDTLEKLYIRILDW